MALAHNTQLRWIRSLEGSRRRAATGCRVLSQLVFACFVILPHLSRAQGCEWQNLPEPSAEVEVIEVLRYGGGIGPPAGRSLARVDASAQIVWLAHGRCPDRTLGGRLATVSFTALEKQFRGAVESIRSQPARPSVYDAQTLAAIVREGRLEPLCQSSEDGVDVDVTLYHGGSREHYKCVSGALLRFGENVIRLVSDSICGSALTSECVERFMGRP